MTLYFPFLTRIGIFLQLHYRFIEAIHKFQPGISSFTFVKECLFP